MQGFPTGAAQAAAQATAQTTQGVTPVAAVGAVSSPPLPAGVSMNWGPLTGPWGGASPQFAPGFYRVPGPAQVAGPAGIGQQSAVCGVPGVAMAPMAGVPLPAAAGGPHPLPPLPYAPLPQGFPNPFAALQAPQQQFQPGAAPWSPGTVTYTGPQGYMPGIGQFALPGTAQKPWAGLAQKPLAGFGQVQPQVPAAAPTSAQPHHPFWLQLAWQLLQAPAVREALADRYASLVQPHTLANTLMQAAACLTSPELLSALQALSAGALDTSGFMRAFTVRFRAELDGR